MYDKEELISLDELTERVKDKDALLNLLSTKVTKEVIDAAPNLKIVANYGAGYDILITHMLEKRDCGNEYTESINGSDGRINICTSSSGGT